MSNRRNNTPISPFAVVAFVFFLFIGVAIPPLGIVLLIVAAALQGANGRNRRQSKRMHAQLMAVARQRAIEKDRDERIAAARSLRA